MTTAELKTYRYTIFTGSGPSDFALTTVKAENMDDAERLLKASYKPENLSGLATEEQEEETTCKYRFEVEISPSNFAATTITARNVPEARKLLKILYEERLTRSLSEAANRLHLPSFKAKIKFDDGVEVWTAIQSDSTSNAQRLLNTLYHPAEIIYLAVAA